MSNIAAAADKNLNMVRSLVERSENPHPSLIVLIIFGTMLIVYFYYITMVKKLITGKWSDDKDDIYTIKHDKWKDTLIISGPNYLNYGIIKCNLVVIYEGKTVKTGVWLNDIIEWVDGSSWHCIYGY